MDGRAAGRRRDLDPRVRLGQLRRPPADRRARRVRAPAGAAAPEAGSAAADLAEGVGARVARVLRVRTERPDHGCRQAAPRPGRGALGRIARERRRPGAVHAWHTDAESSAPSCWETVAAWVGLANTNRRSSLKVVTRSHRFGKPIQEIRHAKGIGRGDVRDDEIEAWARELDDSRRIVQLATGDGEAVFFDGRLWHGSGGLTGAGHQVRSACSSMRRREPPFRFPMRRTGTGQSSSNRRRERRAFS